MDVMQYKLSPTGAKASESTARVKLIWGPVRTGKSMWGCRQVFLKACHAAAVNRSLRAIFVRDTYKNLRDTTLKDWLTLFPDGKFGMLRGEQTAADYTLVLEDTHTGKKHSHEVLFRHGQTAGDASSFLSSAYGMIVLEEVVPAYMPTGEVSPGIAKEVFTIALTRLIQEGIENPELILVFNSPPRTHWVFTDLIQPMGTQYPQEHPEAWHDNRTMDLDILVDGKIRKVSIARFYFPPEENETNLRAGYYNELRAILKMQGQSDDVIDRMIEGKITVLFPGLPVYGGDFVYEKHVRPKLEPIPTQPLILGMDAGLTPAVTITQVDPRGRLLYLKEIQQSFDLSGRLIRQVGHEEFAAYCRSVISSEFMGLQDKAIIADPAINSLQPKDARALAEVWQDEGFRIVNGAIATADREEPMRRRLRLDVGGQPAVLFSQEGCPFLIDGMMGGFRRAISKDQASLLGRGDRLKNQYSHVCEAAEYVVSKLWPLKRKQDRRPPVALPPSAMSA